MANRTVQRVTVTQQHTVISCDELISALRLAGGGEDLLDKTYVVEVLRTQFSDGSMNDAVSIRAA